MPDLADYISPEELARLIAVAKDEDLGPTDRDATSELFIDAHASATGRIVSRQPGTVAGLSALPAISDAYDPHVTWSQLGHDGDKLMPGDAVATCHGPLRSILAIERVALNLLGHLSGVATHTAAFADRIAHTKAKVYDTRKTLPGLRGLQKYAVACGGGGTHRMGLYDAVLVKDNHLAHVPPDQLTQAVREMCEQARSRFADLKFIMVEVDTLDQLRHVLPAGADLILLDNMSLNELREAVTMRDGNAPAVQLEASGGVTLDTVQAIAETGVDRISVGALTHSSVNLDLGLDLS